MHVLITKINFLGDAISFLPTLYGLKQAAPDASITLLCSRTTGSIFRRSVKGIKVETVDFAKTRRSAALSTVLIEAWRLRTEKADVALHAHDEPSFSYLLSKMLGIRTRIGFASGIARASRFLTDALPFDTGRNVVDINFDLARRVAQKPELKPTRVPLDVSAEEQNSVDRLLQSLNWNPQRPLVLVHPYAKLPYKEWGIENFKVVGKEIEARTDAFVIFVSETGKSPPDFHRTVSGLTIHEFAALCRHSRLLIGNNSGPMNVAAAMGTRTLAIQGPSPPAWAVYWKDQIHTQISSNKLACIPCDSLIRVHGRCTNDENLHGCMRDIEPETVIRRAIEMLAQ